MGTLSEFKVKAFDVTVNGYGLARFYAGNAGKAVPAVWRCGAFDHLSFKNFLRIAKVKRAEVGERFGEAITVGGMPAFLVYLDRQHIHFARPGSDVVLCSHPLDVEPPEARRGTPYYEAPSPPRQDTIPFALDVRGRA